MLGLLYLTIVSVQGSNSFSILSNGTSRQLQPQVGPSTLGGVYINGLLNPTSVSWDQFGNVYISEKAGKIHRCLGWLCTVGENTLILNIYDRITSFGDHGLSRVLWDRDVRGHNWLYVVFMKNI